MRLFIISICLLLLSAIAESKSVRYINIVGRNGKSTQCALQHGETNEENDPHDKDIFEINKDLNYEDGDMIFPKGRSSLVDETRHWQSHQIAVEYAPDLHLEAIASIDLARQEYELRTCLKLVDRTTEDDYIYFETLNGCYSSVGYVGGSQTISIGNGCERIGTVVHEIMHAIGIYHEQSRTDRDDYVTIVWDKITSGKEHNFRTYNYDVIDDREVSYDYNSVMHYSDTGFSIDGSPTIVTSDPTYQDVVGQRRAFSPGDIKKINSMYRCSDTVRVSYSCSFEEVTLCGYVQEPSNTATWTHHSAQSENPLPNISGNFMVFGGSESASGSLFSMKYLSKVSTQCLEFSYHMSVGATSSASLNVYVASINSLDGTIVSLGDPVTTITGNHAYDWNVEQLSISAPSEYVLAFKADTEAGDIIALDDISVVDKPCETSYFIINDFTELVEQSVVGDYIYSPVMYTDDGYAFQIKIYPVGTSSSKDGHMAMFYHVAKGDNDDDLSWPFTNRFIRFSVVDQDPDAVVRMSQSNNFVSSSDSSAWEKPTSERNGGYGYSSFMPVSDILNTRNFLKNNAVMISVLVTDMTYATATRRGQISAMAHQASDMHYHSHEESQPSSNDDWSMSVSQGMIIIGVTSLCVFIVMFIALLVINEKHSKELFRIANRGLLK